MLGPSDNQANEGSARKAAERPARKPPRAYLWGVGMAIFLSALAIADIVVLIGPNRQSEIPSVDYEQFWMRRRRCWFFSPVASWLASRRGASMR